MCTSALPTTAGKWCRVAPYSLQQVRAHAQRHLIEIVWDVMRTVDAVTSPVNKLSSIWDLIVIRR